MEIKILYVDDEPMNLEIFKINFMDNYEVLTAGNGRDGLRILDENPEIIVVFSDMRMPVMTGVEFIKKAKERFPDTPFFILTGFEINSEIQGAIDTGLVSKYFSKPFNVSEINAVIIDAINDK